MATFENILLQGIWSQAGLLWIVSSFHTSHHQLNSSVEKCTSPLAKWSIISFTNQSIFGHKGTLYAVSAGPLLPTHPTSPSLMLFFLSTRAGSPTVPPVFDSLWRTILMGNGVFRVLNISKSGWRRRSKQIFERMTPVSLPSLSLSPLSLVNLRGRCFGQMLKTFLPPPSSLAARWSNVDETMVMTPTRPCCRLLIVKTRLSSGICPGMAVYPRLWTCSRFLLGRLGGKQPGASGWEEEGSPKLYEARSSSYCFKVKTKSSGV